MTAETFAQASELVAGVTDVEVAAKILFENGANIFDAQTILQSLHPDSVYLFSGRINEGQVVTNTDGKNVFTNLVDPLPCNLLVYQKPSGVFKVIPMTVMSEIPDHLAVDSVEGRIMGEVEILNDINHVVNGEIELGFGPDFPVMVYDLGPMQIPLVPHLEL